MKKIILAIIIALAFNVGAEQKYNDEGYPVDDEGYVIMDSSANYAYMNFDPNYSETEQQENSRIRHENAIRLEENRQAAIQEQIEAQRRHERAIANQQIRQQQAAQRQAARQQKKLNNTIKREAQRTRDAIIAHDY